VWSELNNEPGMKHRAIPGLTRLARRPERRMGVRIGFYGFFRQFYRFFSISGENSIAPG